MDHPTAPRTFVWTLIVGLLAFGIAGSGCELFGADSGDEAPAWVGNWQVTSLDGRTPDRPRFWSITRTEWDIVEETSNGGCSVLDHGTITERNDNVVTVDFNNEGTLRLRLTVSGDSLASVLANGPESSDDVVAAEAINFNPLDRLGC